MLLYSIVSNVLSLASLVGLAVACCEMFCGVSLRSAPVAVSLSVKLNVTVGEGVSIVSGGSVEKRELLTEELARETGDGVRSNPWIFNISIYSVGVLVTVYFVSNLFLLLVYSNGSAGIL